MLKGKRVEANPYNIYNANFNSLPTISLLQNSYWFECGCAACTSNWTYFLKLPRDYFKLSGAHFKYKRCNRKQLQKDVDKLKKRIRTVC